MRENTLLLKHIRNCLAEFTENRSMRRHTLRHNVVMLVTSVTRKREQIFSDGAICREAIETVYRVKHLHPFSLYGFVVMPDHVHLLVKIPQMYTISKMMNVLKTGTAINAGIHRLWQRGFDVQPIDNPRTALAYVHMNPVLAGMVDTPEEYPWSSASGKWIVDPLPIAAPKKGHC